MASLEGNIHAVEVDGTFDDCQRLVKESFADMEIVAKHTLTTANSINLGRLLPQISYYFWGLAQLQRQRPNLHEAPIFVVPSGNLGNLTAALYAKWMGAPMGRLAAGTNVNDVLPTYLSSGSFIPRTSIQTISNAMDVGNPSNLARIQALYKNDVERMRNDVEAISITDAETLQEIDRTYRRTGYLLDPHSAVGAIVARRMQEATRLPIVILATAHPAKFPETVEKAIGLKVPLPPSLQEAMARPKRSTRVSARFEEWKELLLRVSRRDAETQR
jgi:threonine synthase